MSAFEETLELLEWPRLCEHLSSFASTVQGRRACRVGALPESLPDSLLLQSRTLEMAALDGLLEGGLSFQGVSDLARSLLRCSKGGTASGEELLAVAETLGAARRLRRQIDDPDLSPHCTALLVDVATLPELSSVSNSRSKRGAASRIAPVRCLRDFVANGRSFAPGVATSCRR